MKLECVVFDLWPSGLSILMGRLRSHLLLHCCMAAGRWCSRQSMDSWLVWARHWTERISWPRPHLAEHWNTTTQLCITTEQTLICNKNAALDPWMRPIINQKHVSPLPRDPSPTEGEGSAAGYSAPWRWAGHAWDTWTLAACPRSPRSYTRPHGAWSQDHNWACTADGEGDEKKRGRKRKKRRENIRWEGGQGDGGDGRVQQRVTAVTSMQEEIFLIHSAEVSSCIRNKVESPLSSCK